MRNEYIVCLGWRERSGAAYIQHGKRHPIIESAIEEAREGYISGRRLLWIEELGKPAHIPSGTKPIIIE